MFARSLQSIIDACPELAADALVYSGLAFILLPTKPMKNRQREKRSRVSQPRLRAGVKPPVVPQAVTVTSPVSKKHQFACIDLSRQILDEASAEYNASLALFDQTQPTAEDFTAVTDRLHVASRGLATARENFKICCATI